MSESLEIEELKADLTMMSLRYEDEIEQVSTLQQKINDMTTLYQHEQKEH